MQVRDLCVNLFNKENVELQSYIPLLTEYLTDKNKSNISTAVSVVVSNPMFFMGIYEGLKEYFCRKYNIFSVIYNNKILCYY